MISKNLSKIRESKGLGINELSRKAEVNASYISAIERGDKKNPSMKILSKLANALEIPIEDLLKENSDKNTTECEEDFLNKLTEENRLLFKKIRSLSPEDAKKVLDIIKVFEKENDL